MKNNDVYIDYPYEKVMFRCMKDEDSAHKKFYGNDESAKPVPFNNDLFNQALLNGEEITKEQYEQGKLDH